MYVNATDADRRVDELQDNQAAEESDKGDQFAEDDNLDRKPSMHSSSVKDGLADR